jgi:hypothetical protein
MNGAKNTGKRMRRETTWREKRKKEKKKEREKERKKSEELREGDSRQNVFAISRPRQTNIGDRAHLAIMYELHVAVSMVVPGLWVSKVCGHCLLHSPTQW